MTNETVASAAPDLPPLVLPRPLCTYADHSYPAFSKAQVVEFATTYARAALAHASPASPAPDVHSRLMEMSAIIRAGVKWTGNEYAFADLSESDVSMLDDLLGDALSKLHAPASPASAPVAPQAASNAGLRKALEIALENLEDTRDLVKQGLAKRDQIMRSLDAKINHARAALAAPVAPTYKRSQALESELLMNDASHRAKFAQPAAPVEQAGVLDGWKLVPVEPTDVMVLAPGALRTSGNVARIHRAIYAAMLAAAPLPPVVARKVLTDDLRALLDAARLGQGSYHTNYDGAKLGRGIEDLIERHLMGGE